jgi:hypothetical protein
MGALLIVLWLALSFFKYGALLAHSLGEFPSQSKHQIRSDMSVCMLFSLIPIAGTFVAIFATGFLSYGWRIK